MTFYQQLAITLIDKAAIGLVVVVTGFWLNRLLEAFRSQQSLRNEIAKMKRAKEMDFIERQLSQFYWPIYLRLQIDGAVWERILDRKAGNDDLRRKVGEEIEKNSILPNHEEIVGIIQANFHLANCSPETFQLLLRYIRHVAVYKALRSANTDPVFPISLGEPWPAGLSDLIGSKARDLQEQYDSLVANDRA